jgi:hypothetical protein
LIVVKGKKLFSLEGVEEALFLYFFFLSRVGLVFEGKTLSGCLHYLVFEYITVVKLFFFVVAAEKKGKREKKRKKRKAS